MVLRFHDGRFHEIARLTQYLPSVEDFPSRLLHLFDSLPIGLDRSPIDQRPPRPHLTQWIADAVSVLYAEISFATTSS